MKAFRDKVAVITGAASGIGQAIADRCAMEGMKVVLADIEREGLVHAEARIKAHGGEVLSVVTDVSKLEDVEALAQRTLETFGAVHLLCNNAGVGSGLPAWDTTVNEWMWVLGVNLWGVIHGIQAFVPTMLAQDSESHVVNTSSIAGLVSYHTGAAYHASKHAVVAISEKMYYDLGENRGRVKVSVLCPGYVETRILQSERNRPAALRDDAAELRTTPYVEAAMGAFQRTMQAGIAPNVVADRVFQALRNDQFYILTHPEYAPIAGARLEAIASGSNPQPLAELIALLGE